MNEGWLIIAPVWVLFGLAAGSRAEEKSRITGYALLMFLLGPMGLLWVSRSKGDE